MLFILAAKHIVYIPQLEYCRVAYDIHLYVHSDLVHSILSLAFLLCKSSSAGCCTDRGKHSSPPYFEREVVRPATPPRSIAPLTILYLRNGLLDFVLAETEGLLT
jgi:hypothetical protein